MMEPERQRTTVALSKVNLAWLHARAQRHRRALTWELDLLIDEMRLQEQQRTQDATHPDTRMRGDR